MNDLESFTRAVRRDPLNDGLLLAFSDWMEEHGDTLTADLLRRGRIPLKNLDLEAVRYLSQCFFSPASFSKRFARDIHATVAGGQWWLTKKQYWMLWILVRKFRRQIRSDAVLEEAEAIHKAQQQVQKA